MGAKHPVPSTRMWTGLKLPVPGPSLPPVDRPETPYIREPGYAERYRDRRFLEPGGRRTDRLERSAIEELMSLVPDSPGAWLDVPAGAGRLTGLLPAGSLRADRNLAMLRACPPDAPRICASAHQLPFADGSFDGVLCMRLLHHIHGADERRRILAELARVSRGPVILSFFHAVSLQHLRRKLRRLLGKPRSGRGALRLAVLRADLHAAGLELVAARPLRRFVSEQWVLLCRVRT